MPGSSQSWVHWLEAGPGARWIHRAALALAVLILSLLAGYKQFRGLKSEAVLAQAVVGRELAAGEGFSTRVRLPQTLAVLTERGRVPDAADPWPELHQPPLYSLVIGSVLALFPAEMRATLFRGEPLSSGAFRADYILLGINMVLLWLAAWLTAVVARRLFGAAAGMIAALGLLLSAPVWQATVAADGTSLMMVLLLGVFSSVLRAQQASAERRAVWPWLLLAGVLAGALCLGDLAAGSVLLPLVAFVALFHGAGVRNAALAALLLGFFAVTAPWLWRNSVVTGNPLALAGRTVALKAGDPTAEPETVRTTLSAAGPKLDLAKLGNKGTTGIQETVGARLWSGGGIWFTALFAAGFLYRFRMVEAERLRWLFVVTLAVLVCAHAFLGSGEENRQPAVYAVPLIAVFGAGFFIVLVASSEVLAGRLFWASAGLLLLQALPLAHDLAEPHRLPFSYPPYYPPFFAGMRREADARGGLPWMCDAPAGAAWYSDQAVWARPATLTDFRRAGVEQPVFALVLTSRTLRSDYAIRTSSSPSSGDWSPVYSGLTAGRFPPGFPLTQVNRVSDDLVVLLDPMITRRQGK